MKAVNRDIRKRFAFLLFLLMLTGPLCAYKPTQSGAMQRFDNVTDSGALRSLSLPFKYISLSLKEPDEKLLMPVSGIRVKRIENTWGAKREGGRKHAGQDIFAKRGTPVYSATAGFVWHVGESSRGGKTIFVLGAGGRGYYYAHLDKHAEKLTKGDTVTTDTLLGYVGTTGNAQGTPPHLHFSVYTPTAGAINPLPFLADRT